MPTQYITAEELAESLRGGRENVIVVDARDEDRAGGHIKGSVHTGSAEMMGNTRHYAQLWATADKVVFHCMMSQVRGPKCARLFTDALAHVVPKGETKPAVFVLEGGFQQFARGRAQFMDLIEGWDVKYYGSA